MRTIGTASLLRRRGRIVGRTAPFRVRRTLTIAPPPPRWGHWALVFASHAARWALGLTAAAAGAFSLEFAPSWFPALCFIAAASLLPPVFALARAGFLRIAPLIGPRAAFASGAALASLMMQDAGAFAHLRSAAFPASPLPAPLAEPAAAPAQTAATHMAALRYELDALRAGVDFSLFAGDRTLALTGATLLREWRKLSAASARYPLSGRDRMDAEEFSQRVAAAEITEAPKLRAVFVAALNAALDRTGVVCASQGAESEILRCEGALLGDPEKAHLFRTRSEADLALLGFEDVHLIAPPPPAPLDPEGDWASQEAPPDTAPWPEPAALAADDTTDPAAPS